MSRIFILWLACQILLTVGLGNLQTTSVQTTLACPGEAAVGEKQTWYLSIHGPSGQSITGLVVENGSPESWLLEPLRLDTPNRDETLVLSAIARRPGVQRPRLLLGYTLRDKSYRQLVLGEPVTVLAMENRLKVQVVSASQRVAENQPARLTALVENQSPFPVQVSLAVEGPGLKEPAAGVVISLPAGQQHYQAFDLRLRESDTPVVVSTFEWIDDRQEAHSTLVQAAAHQPIEVEPDALTQAGPTLIGVVAGGMFTILTTLFTLWLNRRNERNDQKEKDRQRAEGLMQMVLMHCKQAHALRDAIDMKYLDTMLQDNNLYDVLRTQGMDAVTRDLWVAGQRYNANYNSAHFSEQFDRLNSAIQGYERAFGQRPVNGSVNGPVNGKPARIT